MKKNLLTLIGLIIIIGSVIVYNVNNNSLNKCVVSRGCCSRHGGVCGCQNGRSKCCDGTLSPSCQCFRDYIKGSEI